MQPIRVLREWWSGRRNDGRGVFIGSVCAPAPCPVTRNRGRIFHATLVFDMTRRARPGTIQRAVAASYAAVGGLECAAADLGVSLSVLSYGTEVREDRPGGLGANYLDRLGRIDAAAALPIAQHFATLAGGVFHPVAAGGVGGRDVNAVTREFSDVLAAHAVAHSAASSDPSDYTPAEAAAQITEIDELIAAAMGLRAALVQRIGGAA